MRKFEFDLQVFCTDWNRCHNNIRFFLSVTNKDEPSNVMVKCNERLYSKAIYNTHYAHITSAITDRSDGAMKISSSRMMSLSGIIEFDILTEFEGYDPEKIAAALEWIASVIDPATITNPSLAAQ